MGLVRLTKPLSLFRDPISRDLRCYAIFKLIWNYRDRLHKVDIIRCSTQLEANCSNSRSPTPHCLEARSMMYTDSLMQSNQEALERQKMREEETQSERERERERGGGERVRERERQTDRQTDRLKMREEETQSERERERRGEERCQ